MLNTARIAKNTIFLYLRMILVLAANFLAVRVLLEVLGVDDYGLFNLIVGFVTLFTLLNGAMMSTVQRFLCFELGRATSTMSPPVDAVSSPRQNESPNSTVHLLSRPTFSSSPSSTRLIFTLCFWLFVALSILIFLASELLAPSNLLPYSFSLLPWTLNIPPDRFHSAQIVYQLSILVMVFKTMQIPYTALIVSYERMNAFAKISIVEAVLTLAAAFALKFLPPLSTSTSFLHLDVLVIYSVLYAISQGIVCLTYALYCRHHFAEGHLVSLFPVDAVSSPRQKESPNSTVHLFSPPTFSLLRSLSSFFSWSILGAIANMLKQQGLNVLLNLFFGVAFNATWAVANKIGMAVNQLVGNFQQAFNPQIVKLYAEKDKREYFNLVSNASRYSFLLLWFFALPLMLGCDFFLHLWLKGDLPPQLVIFVNLSVIFILCEAIAAPFWTAIQATGRIGAYQTVVSVLLASVFFIGWAALALGAPAWSVLVSNVVMSLACHIFRVLHLSHRTGFPVLDYIRRAMLPICLVAALSVAFIALERRVLPTLPTLPPLELILVTPMNLLLMLFVGCTSSERTFFRQKLAAKLHRKGGG